MTGFYLRNYLSKGILSVTFDPLRLKMSYIDVFNVKLKVKEVNLSLCLTKHYAMKTYGGVGV
jgi:hypothetical protein